MAMDVVSDEPEAVESELQSMKIETASSSDEEPLNLSRTRTLKADNTNLSATNSPKNRTSKNSSRSSTNVHSSAPSPISGKEDSEDMVKDDIALKMEPGQAPKLSRSASQKTVVKAKLFDHLPDATSDATASFQVIQDCIYSAKHLGSTDNEQMDCDCVEDWNGASNTACGEDSDCINRATKIECREEDCNCGSGCQNRRFQLKQYASVSVIKTEKKGFGLRTDSRLEANDFIFEYIGEVINESQFRKRMIQYDDEGIKHFYFMSLSKGEFVDATRKGNLGRFCNHSCNPNCYVDKWIVGGKLRMGIFAERAIQAGEELVFNYNVDRYGADPQPCYCAEPNCTGYIGGKTQTERATKLSHQTIEALGIDDGDGWDTAVSRKPRRKKQEDDEEYVNNVQARPLDEKGVTSVMAQLVQCKEKWIAVKLLGRIQQCEDERVRNRVVKMHGYQILNSGLATWKDDFNVVLQILDILNKFPRITRNKISDSKIDKTVETLTTCGHDRVQNTAAALLKAWSSLEIGYRIPRKKREENNVSTPDRHDHFQRRESNRDDGKTRSKSRSPEPPKGPTAPSGPRNNIPQRNPGFFGGSRPVFRPPPPRLFQQPLPLGWFRATSNGKTYYYSANGATTWQRPTTPAPQPPPPPKPMTSDQRLQEIIDSITKAVPKEKPPVVPPQERTVEEVKKEKKKEGQEKWRTLSEEKKKKLYENTLFPHVKHVMDKFKGKLPREELKRFGKEIAKKIVSSDFKNNRVEDPTQISSKQEKQVKKYIKEYFDKAVAKKRDHDKKKAERKSQSKQDANSASAPANDGSGKEDKSAEESGDDELMDMSDNEEHETKSPSVIASSNLADGDGLKRKRDEEMDLDDGVNVEDDSTPSKKIKSETSTPPPPPPPPPPPAEDYDGQAVEESDPDGMEGLEEARDRNALTPTQADAEGLEPNGCKDALSVSPAVNSPMPETPAETENTLKDDEHTGFPTEILQSGGESSANGASRSPENQYEGMNPERLRMLGLV